MSNMYTPRTGDSVSDPAHTAPQPASRTGFKKDMRERQRLLKQELQLDQRFQSGMYDRAAAVQQKVAVVEVDFSGRVFQTNAAFCTLIGYDAREHRTPKFVSLLHPGTETGSKWAVRTLLTGKVWQGKLCFRHQATGAPIWLDITITPLRTEENALPYKFIGVGFDVSGQVDRKEELKKLMAQQEAYKTQLEETREHLQEKVSAQTRTVQESMNYAVRILRAMLPSSQTLDRAMPSTFQLAWLNKPRGKVGGDFIWSGYFNSTSVLAMGDAPGNGVAAALISLLAIGQLSREVDERGNVDPRTILRNIHQSYLKRNLKRARYRKNVLDMNLHMGVLALEANSAEVRYATAGIQGYHATTDRIELLENATTGLGDLDLPVEAPGYRTNRVRLGPGDTLYYVSNGFSAQVSDNRQGGQAFGQERLMELLTEVNEIPVLEDRIRMFEFRLQEWMGILTDQTDDIMVAAIQFKP